MTNNSGISSVQNKKDTIHKNNKTIPFINTQHIIKTGRKIGKHGISKEVGKNQQSNIDTENNPPWQIAKRIHTLGKGNFKGFMQIVLSQNRKYLTKLNKNVNLNKCSKKCFDICCYSNFINFIQIRP